MTEKTEQNKADVSPDENEGTAVALSPISEAECADLIDQAERVFSYALREEGLHLWEMKYFDSSVARPLEKLLRSDTDPALRDAISGVLKQVQESASLAWFDRIEPLQAAHKAFSALAAKSATTDVELTAQAEVLLTEQFAGPNKKTERDDRGGRRGRRRRRGRGPQEETVAAPRPPRIEPHHFGEEGRTGTQLVDVEGHNTDLLPALQAAGVATVKDLLLLQPARHENLKCVEDFSKTKSGTTIAVRGKPLAQWSRLTPKGARFDEAAISVGEGTLRLSLDEKKGLPKLQPGASLAAVGTLRKKKTGTLLEEPVFWQADSRGTIRRPEYELEGAEDAALRVEIRKLLDTYSPGLRDTLPEAVVRKANLLELKDALRELHVPSGGIRHGRKRFVFEELFRHQMDLAAKERTHRRGIAHPIKHELITQIQVQHGIILDDAQEQAFDEIRRDLAKPLAMSRLLQGDVGSGKAAVSLLAAVLVASSRSQVLFIAPNRLAAEHRFLFAEPLFRSVGLLPQLVSGKPSAGQLDAIKRGQASVIFATPDFIDPVVPEFKRLGLVVREERSTFGTTPADLFKEGKGFADYLIVTSVPVPPSLAFTVFSGVDITVIGSAGSAADSVVAQPHERDSVYDALREILQSGKQAYVVFPMRNGEDIIDRERGQVLANAMAQEAFPGHTVALFHGTMNRDERAKIYDDFLHRRIDVLIATTAIEDAPEVNNASGVMVENADHFDLVRLYRLRGHVDGRDPDAKCFFVLSKDPSENGTKLVELVAKETDAFALAERDREQRGDDALLGDLAETMPGFLWADLSKDRDILVKARRTVFSILSEDPTLERRAYRGLVDGPTKAGKNRDTGHSPNANKRRRRPRRRRRKGGGAPKEA